MAAMTADEIAKILDAHIKWRRGEVGGSRADLSRADLRDANLSRADLRDANLSRANLSRANLSLSDLSGANLSRADLRDADLSRANLSRANLSLSDLSRANLSGANLSDANLSDADLSDADLRRANLSRADLSRANLSGANLSRANLSVANLSVANLSRANLSVANLSRAKGYRCPSAWVAAQEVDAAGRGIIVYKQIGLLYSPPAHWKIEKGSVLTEAVNPDRGTECGSGINIAPRNWGGFEAGRPIWRCLIEWRDLATLVVPFQTDGKARVGRLTLIEEVS